MRGFLFLVFALPTLALVFWAGWYLRGYFDALDDTYYGMTFTYEGAKGPVVGRADAIRFDWRTGEVFGEGVTLAQVGAPAILDMARIDAIVPLPWTGRESVNVRARDGYAGVVRYEDGTWSFEDLTPAPPAEPAEPTPVEVDATNVRVRFHDRFVKEPTTWNLAAATLRVGVVGPDASAKFRGVLDGVGPMDAEFDIVDGAVAYVHLSGQELKILPLKDYFAQWEGLRGTDPFSWTADSAVFSGKVSARPSESGDWIVRGEGTAAASDLVYGDRRFARIEFTGGFTEAGIGGRIIGAGPGVDVDGVGFLAFGETLTGRIEGRAGAGSAAAVEAMLSDVLPGDVDFRGATFDGVVVLGEKLTLSGDLTAASVTYDGETATGVRATIASDGRLVRVSNASGRAFGAQVLADLAITLGEKPTIDGRVSAENVRLATVPGLPRDLIQGGMADVSALLSGPLSDPVVSAQATGNTTLVVNFEEQSVPHDVRFAVAGDYRRGVFEITSGAVGGELGSVQGTGTVNVDSGAMALDVFASGIDLTALPGSSITGTAYGDLRITGTTGDPRAAGLVEVYGASIDQYTLPFASAEVTYTGRRLVANDIVARRGVSLVEGDAVVDLVGAAWPVSGKGRVIDLMVGDFTGDAVTGLANGNWELNGTFEDPNVAVDVVSPSLLADRIEIRDVVARARWADERLSIGSMTGTVSGGRISAEGGWSMQGESQITVNVDDVSAWALRPYFDGLARFTGRISGNAVVDFLNGEVQDGGALVTARDLEINREPIGSASISAQIDSKRVNFSGGLGTLESNYVIENGVFNFENRTARADFYALGGNLENIMRIVASLAEDATAEQRQMMRQVDGVLALDGTIEAAEIDGKWKVTGGRADARASDLIVEGEAAGEAHIVAQRQDGRTVLETADWTGPQAGLRLNPGQNFIDDSGEILLDGEIYNIDLNWFKNFSPSLAAVEGRADISFIARGVLPEPEIDATIATEGLKFSDLAIDLNAGPFFIRQGSITAGDPRGIDPNDPGAGFVRFRDLEARLIGVNIPFEFPFTIPRDRPLEALVIVPDKDIDEISEFLAIDPENSEGRVFGGRLNFSGTLDALETSGGITLEAPRLKFTASDTTLVDAFATAQLEGDMLRVESRGAGSAGGTFTSQSRIAFDGLVIQEGSFIKTEALRFAQNFGTDSRASGILNADLQLSGEVFQPLIQGRVEASEAAMRIAGELGVTEGVAVLPINPTFDVELMLTDGQVANGPVEAQASGTGFLRGPLSVLDARMDFVVDSGELALPSARIRLERGGTATFLYSKNFVGEREASLDVNLNASTRVTSDGGFGPQRYVISMEVRGDLLSDDELQITATSDPPDLSQQQILAILGQADLIQNVAATGFSRFEDQLKTLLSSVAAPLFLGQVSRSIEDALGLDYFSVDFTGSGIGGITVAKSLGNGFTLEYRRVLEQYALAGESLEEIRLTYRLPTSNPLLGRLTLGIAATREGLFKATLSYSKRF